MENSREILDSPKSVLTRAASLIAVVAISSLSIGAHATDTTVEDQYKAYLSKARAITPQSEFGDQISLRDGTLSFKVTDINVPGTGPDIKITRSALIQEGLGGEEQGANRMGGWELEVPRITTITANGSNFDRGSTIDPSSPVGWQVAAPDKNSRCTNFGAPGDVTYGADRPVEFFAQDWWMGYTLTDQEGNGRKLLSRSPTLPGNQYKIGTSDNWVISCLTHTSNNEPGEAFLATSPDGTKYWFDYLVYTEFPSLSVPFDDMPPKGLTLTYTLARRLGSMLVSRIEDRHGNWVNYQYSGPNLTQISASDGRIVTLDNSGAVTRIVVGSGASARPWIYNYSDSGKTSLSSVVLPDGSSWSYTGTFSKVFARPYTFTGCSQESIIPFQPNVRSVTVTSPGGATATYTVENRTFGRSYVLENCVEKSIYSPGVAMNPKLYIGVSLTSRSITGPGLAPATWTYQYSAPNASFSNECSPSCVSEVWTDVLEPQGSRLRSTFSNKVDQTENKLNSLQIFDSNGALVRKTEYTYATADWLGSNPYPWPLMIGSQPDEYHGNFQVESRWTPIKKTSVNEGGVSYQREILSYDAWSRPLAVSRGILSGDQKSVSTAYHDDLQKWVIGQVASTTCTAPATCAGLVESRTVFDPATSLPSEIYEFGSLKAKYTYTPGTGTLASISDGQNNKTTYSAWKRGLPQLVTFADMQQQSAAVDDIGRINSVTDEAGYSTTYEYDPMGRLAKVNYPAEDDLAWHPTTQVFESVNAAEFGLPAGHWRQTVKTENAFKITYYDGLWQPLLVQEYDALDQAGTQRFQKFAYDANGRQTFTSYPSTSSAPTTGVRTTYDALGRATKVSQDTDLQPQPLDTVTTYLSGNRTEVVDPKLNKVATTYQAYDQPSYENPTLILAPEDARTTISRDAFGKPLWITRSNGDGSLSVTRSYVYQADQQLCKSLEPEAGATVYEYDAAGNMTKSTAGLNLQQFADLQSCGQPEAASSGRSVTRTYDLRNRLANLSFPDGRGNQTWVYTTDGLPDQVTTNNTGGGDAVVNNYSYNHRRLLVGEDMTQAGTETVSMDYGYDQYGHLAMHLYPSGLSVAYAPNALGQSTKAGTYATEVTYFPNGGIKHFVYGNGIAHDMVQNLQQQPVSSTDGSVMQMAYAYDKSGNVASTTDYVDGRQTRTMTYDGLNRLLTTNSVMFGGNNQAVFTYDALDNLKTFKVGDKVDYQYSYDNQKLILATNAIGPSVGVGYDLQGNVENRNGKHFDFDYGNRLRCNATAANCTGSIIERYRYDANGRRVLNDSPTLGKIFSLYGQDGVLRRQQDQRTGKNSEYVYLDGSLVARVINAQALPVPSTSVPASSTTGLYTVTWTATANTTSYQIQEKAGSAVAWTDVYTGTNTTLTVSGKGDGAYSYRARSCLYANCGAWSNEATVAVQLVPASAPSISSPATAIGGNFTVTWSSVTSSASYKLEQQLGAGAWSEVYAGTSLSTAFSTLAAGTYGYRVRACGTGGCGDYSGLTQTTVIYAPATPAAPATPVSNASGTYTVSWTSVDNAGEYRLEESANGGAWTQLAVGSGTSQAVSGRASGSYGYRLLACNNAGCSGSSATATTTVLLPPSTAPTVTAPSTNATGSYAVSWSVVSGAASYELQEDGAAIYSGTSTSTVISGKGNGSYQYTARACNGSGCGPWSAVAATTVSLPPPNSTPTISAPASSNTGSYNVNWSATGDTTGYQLQENKSGAGWVDVYAGPGTSFSATGRANGVYQYIVRACNPYGCGAWSNAVSIQVNIPPPVPAMPASLTGYVTYDNSLRPPIKENHTIWSAVDGATSYDLMKASSIIYSGPMTEYEDYTKPVASYQVRACNSSGCSAWKGGLSQ